jgi:hypothetical protein
LGSLAPLLEIEFSSLFPHAEDFLGILGAVSAGFFGILGARDRHSRGA